MVSEIRGSILDAPVDTLILHQCNCVTKGSLGLAASIFAKWPNTNTYGNKRTPGTIDCIGQVVNLYAQRYPGQPRSYETESQRKEWMRTCLAQLATLLPHDKVTNCAIPYGIGCGLAGGSWSDYLAIFEEWERQNTHVHVVVYQQQTN